MYHRKNVVPTKLKITQEANEILQKFDDTDLELFCFLKRYQIRFYRKK